jgi:osmotically-inducible protein OsmY
MSGQAARFTRATAWACVLVWTFLDSLRKDSNMNAIPDSEILKSIHDRLQRAGATQERIRATVDHGSVKLMGSLQFEMQRRAYLKVVSAIAGVGRIDDQMQVSQKKKK